MIGQDKIEEGERYIAGWEEAGYNCKLPDPIGQLVHEPTMTRLSVYKPISRFKRIMLRIQAHHAKMVLRAEIREDMNNIANTIIKEATKCTLFWREKGEEK